MITKNKVVICIPDLHCPFQHRDAFDFLKLIKKRFTKGLKPGELTVINLGDEVDNHAISMHDHSQELFSASDEFEKAIAELKILAKIFPDMTFVESNHGSLVYRRAKKYGIPLRVIKSYSEMLEAPPGWRWFFDHRIKLPNGQTVYFHHGKTPGMGKLSQTMGVNACQGHHHEKFHLTYWSNGEEMFWDAHAGCLIDREELCFEYGRNNLKSPMLGCLVIVDSVPHLIPMILDKKGRWVGELGV